MSNSSNPQTCCVQHTNRLGYGYQVFQLRFSRSPFGEQTRAHAAHLRNTWLSFSESSQRGAARSQHPWPRRLDVPPTVQAQAARARHLLQLKR